MARDQVVERLLTMGNVICEFGGVLGSRCPAGPQKAQWLLGEAIASVSVIEHPEPDDVFLLILVVESSGFRGCYRRVSCDEVRALTSLPISSLKRAGRSNGGFGCLAVYQEENFVHWQVLERVIGLRQTTGGTCVD